MAHLLVDHVFSRPIGTLEQELGGVGISALVLASAAGLSADDAEAAELERVLSKPIEHFRARNDAKVAAGFLATGLSVPHPSFRVTRIGTIELAAQGFLMHKM